MALHVKAAIDELSELRARGAEKLSVLLIDMARAQWRGDFEAESSLTAQLEDLLTNVLTISDLLGRRRLWLTYDAMVKRRQPAAFAADDPVEWNVAHGPPFPFAPFKEALADLVRREPRLERDYLAVAEAYKTGPVFAMARSTRKTLTDKIQALIASQMRESNLTRPQAIKAITSEGVAAGMRNWTDAYAETVYATNLSTAYTAGRFAQARDPDVAAVIGGFEYMSQKLPTSRDNHVAADGLIAGTTDPIWKKHATPAGYNCHCSLREVDRFELARRGLIDPQGRVKRFIPPGFAAAHPDPGFEVKPAYFFGLPG